MIVNVVPSPDVLSTRDRAARLVDDAVHHRESESGALPDFLRREERLEDALLHLVRHSDARVAHDERRRSRAVPRSAEPSTLCRGDGERSAGRHRVARVDGEIEQHLLELSAVGAHARQRRRSLSMSSSMCSPMMRRSIGADAAHDVAEIEHRRLQHLLAAEREQLVREIRGAIGRVDHLAEIVRGGAGLVGAHQRELRVAGDDRDQIVEVVRDAAGERADRLELLRLAKLRLALAQRRFDARALADLVRQHDVRRRELGRALLDRAAFHRRANPSAD